MENEKKTAKGILKKNKNGYLERTKKDFKLNKSLYLMILPIMVWYIMFCYVPMYGVIIAFKDFVLDTNIGYFWSLMKSPWAGLRHFKMFVTLPSFGTLMRNTFLISAASLVFGFPIPIIFALLLNEVRQKKFKSTVQTLTYLPHFVSVIVICGLIRDFTGDSGIITMFCAKLFGREATAMLAEPNLFVPIYTISGIWQEFGWGSILYLATLAGIDQELYEAGRIDGANRFGLAWHISLPGLMPTIVLMLILRMGGLLNVGYEKIILLYNPLTYETADVISTYNYRSGLIGFRWSYSAAIGLFNSAINFVFLWATNAISRKFSESSLW